MHVICGVCADWPSLLNNRFERLLLVSAVTHQAVVPHQAGVPHLQ
jgi:hypothetical protein